MSAYWFSLVQTDSTQETLISENRVFIQANSHGTFLWILMPVSTTLASQGLLRPSPKSCSPCNIFSANSCTPGDPHNRLQGRSSSQFTGNTQWSLGEGACSQVAAAYTSGSRVDSDSMVSDGQGGEQGFGFWPEFIHPVVTSPLLLSRLSL
jgi:hypothetical protein